MVFTTQVHEADYISRDQCETFDLIAVLSALNFQIKCVLIPPRSTLRNHVIHRVIG
jgi:hypothetical protein